MAPSDFTVTSFGATSMRYDIAEVVDPLVHVVAKIHKRVIAQLK